MLHNFFTLVFVGLSAFVISLAIHGLRKKEWPRFREWWDAEGLPVFILAFLLFCLIATAKGCFVELP
jgi:hypothetical protein